MNYCEDCKNSFKMFYHDCRESDLLVTTNHMVETDKLQSEVRTTLHLEMTTFFNQLTLLQISSLRKQLGQKDQSLREKDKQVYTLKLLYW